MDSNKLHILKLKLKNGIRGSYDLSPVPALSILIHTYTHTYDSRSFIASDSLTIIALSWKATPAILDQFVKTYGLKSSKTRQDAL